MNPVKTTSVKTTSVKTTSVKTTSVKTTSVKTTSAITDNDEILAHGVALRTERSAEGSRVGDCIIMDDGTPGGTEPRVAHP